MDSTSSFVPVVIANEDATPLSQEVNVAAEFVNSSDDERPASSYPLLDRRHYREDPSPVMDLIVPIPLTIGLVLDPDEEVRDFNVWETLTMVTATAPLPQETPDRQVAPGCRRIGIYFFKTEKKEKRVKRGKCV